MCITVSTEVIDVMIWTIVCIWWPQACEDCLTSYREVRSFKPQQIIVGYSLKSYVLLVGNLESREYVGENEENVKYI